ncbi:hypothetical protein [Nocardioides sp. GXQ0305]|uniref:hypothetical protein n=1 Tax=Nocardioides sp. GXQ0305 TaxID=3423912 RepID=UPI003D7CC8C3
MLAEDARKSPDSRPEPVELATLVERWRADGVITADQAEAMLRADHRLLVRVRSEAPSTALAIEALGYLGGVIVVVAALLLSGLYWADLPTGTRLAIAGTGAVALLVGGSLVPQRLGGAASRLRSVLWVGATGAAAGFLVVLGDETLSLREEGVALLASSGAAALAIVLWWVHPHLLQQIAMMVALALTAVALISEASNVEALPGLGIWGVGACWALLGWRGALRPPRVAMALGAAALVIGAATTMAYDLGVGFALASAVLVVLVSVLLSDLVLLAVGAVAVLLVLPEAVDRWFPGALAAPLALLVIGLLLVVTAVWTSRRRRDRTTRRAGSGAPGGDVGTTTPAG